MHVKHCLKVKCVVVCVKHCLKVKCVKVHVEHYESEVRGCMCQTLFESA